MSSGKIFQATGPATQNARLPSCIKYILKQVRHHHHHHHFLFDWQWPNSETIQSVKMWIWTEWLRL